MEMRDPWFRLYEPDKVHYEKILHILKILPDNLDLDAMESDGLSQNEVERLSRGWPYISIVTFAIAKHLRFPVYECIIKNSHSKDVEKLILAIKMTFGMYVVLCLPQSSGGPTIFSKDGYGNTTLRFEPGPMLENLPEWFQRGVRLVQDAITARGL